MRFYVDIAQIHSTAALLTVPVELPGETEFADFIGEINEALKRTPTYSHNPMLAHIENDEVNKTTHARYEYACSGETIRIGNAVFRTDMIAFVLDSRLTVEARSEMRERYKAKGFDQ